MTTPVTGRIHSIENSGIADDPGVRFIVFIQGCRMRCQFCHDPDTWEIGSSSHVVTTDEVLGEALRLRSYWDEKDGTAVNGGEPLLQMGFLIDLFKKTKAQGIHITLDMCGRPSIRGEPFISQLDELMKYTDLLLPDIKHIDNKQHKLLITQSDDNILEMDTYLSGIDKPVWIRHVLVPQRSDYDEYLACPDVFIKTLSNVDKVEALPYHMTGKYEREELGTPYPLGGIGPPKSDHAENAKELLHVEDYQDYLAR